MNLYMIINFLLGAMAIAGFAVIWRNILENHPSLKKWITSIFSFGKIHKVVTCGSCFTYWLALAYTLTITPLAAWTPSFSVIDIFLQWMALSWLSVTLRFGYVAVQELVSRQVHGHHHSN